VDKRHKQKGKNINHTAGHANIYIVAPLSPQKKGCLGQQLASINHAKGFEGKSNCT